MSSRQSDWQHSYGKAIKDRKGNTTYRTYHEINNNQSIFSRTANCLCYLLLIFAFAFFVFMIYRLNVQHKTEAEVWTQIRSTSQEVYNCNHTVCQEAVQHAKTLSATAKTLSATILGYSQQLLVQGKEGLGALVEKVQAISQSIKSQSKQDEPEDGQRNEAQTSQKENSNKVQQNVVLIQDSTSEKQANDQKQSETSYEPQGPQLVRRRSQASSQQTIASEPTKTKQNFRQSEQENIDTTIPQQQL